MDLDALVGQIKLSAEGRELPDIDTDEGGWLDRVLSVAGDLARDWEADPTRRAEAIAGMDSIARMSGALEFLKGDGLESFLRLIYAEQDAQAQACFFYYLEEGATYQERRDAMRKGTQGALIEATRRKVIWESVVSLLSEIGMAAIKGLVVPCIIAAL